MHVQSVSLQGLRESNEDEHDIVLNMDTENKDNNKINIYGVFDGHGGSHVSTFLKSNLTKYFVKKNKHDLFNNNKITIKYIRKVFDHVQNKLKKEKFAEHEGSTALLAIHNMELKKNNLWVANTGDSRCVICNKYNIAVQLSKDHKPNNFEERSRIHGLNGKISFDGSDWRIKDLSLSRAFGDLDATPFVTHKPQIFKYKISSRDKFLILACDGLWDVLSNQEAVNFVLECCNFGKQNNTKISDINIADKLANFALKSGSTDNITVVIQFFENLN
ncbi:Protein phosphatase 2C [seawater metagenome]|uniref:Protein phosphatase 2C n=1 Tax=seawater metagenome TaxID=1561972 RepID=A0A5E8CLS8_9ZZZZ